MATLLSQFAAFDTNLDIAADTVALTAHDLEIQDVLAVGGGELVTFW